MQICHNHQHIRRNDGNQPEQALRRHHPANLIHLTLQGLPFVDQLDGLRIIAAAERDLGQTKPDRLLGILRPTPDDRAVQRRPDGGVDALMDALSFVGLGAAPKGDQLGAAAGA